VAAALAPAVRKLEAPETGWSSLGVVVGATGPEPARRVREILPRALVLVPGYGVQGGCAADALAAFVPGPDGRPEGGLVSSSRALLFPSGSDTHDARAWERAVDAAVARATDELAEACVRRVAHAAPAAG
jgi:orotidine-5'-phosphate decarboxylase